MKAKNRGYFRSGVGEVKFRQCIGFSPRISPAQMPPNLPGLLYVLPTLFSLNYAKKQLRNAQKDLLLIASLN